MRVSRCACLLRGKRPFLGGKGGWGKTQADLDGWEGYQPAERTMELNARNPGREEQLSSGKAGSRSQVSRGRGATAGWAGRRPMGGARPPDRPSPRPPAPMSPTRPPGPTTATTSPGQLRATSARPSNSCVFRVPESGQVGRRRHVLQRTAGQMHASREGPGEDSAVPCPWVWGLTSGRWVHPGNLLKARLPLHPAADSQLHLGLVSEEVPWASGEPPFQSTNASPSPGTLQGPERGSLPRE